MQNGCALIAIGLNVLAQQWSHNTCCIWLNCSLFPSQTFNCVQFGDDETRYLSLDQSLDCDSPKHKAYQLYAISMAFVYPFGITMLYASLLISFRHDIQARDRATNRSLIKIAFLYEMYENENWWFEIFECLRRLVMSGLLIFIKPGTASQIVVAMLLSIFSIVVYVNFAPFLEDGDDVLAAVTQVSIFFTLLGALLVRVKIDNDYDQQIFGYLLIGINLAGVGMVFATKILEPVVFVMGFFDHNHTHNARIKGLTEAHDEDTAFVAYFNDLASSLNKEAGYQDVSVSLRQSSKR